MSYYLSVKNKDGNFDHYEVSEEVYMKRRISYA